MAQGESDTEQDHMLLMATTTDEEDHQADWYLDTGVAAI
jgi:hypothetical protein